jgi:Protein of unknown function (DUF4238)
MTHPKQHHYVHESYLEQFVVNGEPLQVVDKWELGRVFPDSPGNILKEKSYFSQPLHEEQKMDFKLETFFSTIEGKWPELIQAIVAGHELSDEMYSDFLQCLIMLRVRVPNARKAIEACLRHSVREAAELVDDPKLKDLIDAGSIKISVDPHRSIGLMSQLAQTMGSMLGRMRSRSFLHNKTSTQFITSDNLMVIYQNSKNSDRPEPYPTAENSDFSILFPLTPQIAFYYDSSQAKRLQHRTVRSPKTVQKMNSLIALFADRFIVGSNSGAVDMLRNIANVCPIPDFARSIVMPDRIHQLSYAYGSPVQMDGWKYEFQE